MTDNDASVTGGDWGATINEGESVAAIWAEGRGLIATVYGTSFENARILSHLMAGAKRMRAALEHCISALAEFDPAEADMARRVAVVVLAATTPPEGGQ